MLKSLWLELQPAGWGNTPPYLLITQTHSKRQDPGTCPGLLLPPAPESKPRALGSTGTRCLTCVCSAQPQGQLRAST